MPATLGLGTVQFGLDYGVSNSDGMVSPEQIGRILAEARRLNLKLLDTAAGYGKSETLLGDFDLGDFKVVTKTKCFHAKVSGQAADDLEAGLRKSLQNLRLHHVYGLLVHNAQDLICAEGEALFERMISLKERGLVSKIGVSVYDASEIESVVQKYPIDICQLPVNALDQRLVRSGHIRNLAKAGIEVHARSVFLQGLLLMQGYEIPQQFAPYGHLLENWRSAVRQQGFSQLGAALSFIRELEEITVGIVGAITPSQLRESADAFETVTIFNAEGLASEAIGLLDPRTWTD